MERSTRPTEDIAPVNPLEKLGGLLAALKLMDAAIVQNLYHDKLLSYRNVLLYPVLK